MKSFWKIKQWVLPKLVPCSAVTLSFQVFPDCDTLKIEQDFNGVHYEADEASVDFKCS